MVGTITTLTLGLLALCFLGLHWLNAHTCPQTGCMTKPMEQFHNLQYTLGLCTLLSCPLLAVSWALPRKMKYQSARIVASLLSPVPMFVVLYKAF